MNRKFMACFALAGVMTFTACSSMNDSQKSMATGAAIGGAAAGIISGEWGWAAAGAAAGAVGGYLYDKNK
jgi:osmotically inducible lipoprotein OsmB